MFTSPYHYSQNYSIHAMKNVTFYNDIKILEYIYIYYIYIIYIPGTLPGKYKWFKENQSRVLEKFYIFIWMVITWYIRYIIYTRIIKLLSCDLKISLVLFTYLNICIISSSIRGFKKKSEEITKSREKGNLDWERNYSKFLDEFQPELDQVSTWTWSCVISRLEVSQVCYMN